MKKREVKLIQKHAEKAAKAALTGKHESSSDSPDEAVGDGTDSWGGNSPVANQDQPQLKPSALAFRENKRK